MASTPSTMMPLGTIAPDFTLWDTVSDKKISLTDLMGKKATVITFICNHCPYVKHINQELVRVANDYKDKEVNFCAISSNDVENYPEDSPELMKVVAKKLNYPFPYLYDETQEVARAYEAACTPDFFVFDGNLKCAYRGQFDNSRPGNNIRVTGNYLRAALNDILKGEKVSIDQVPSIGCNIKWKKK